MTILFSFALAFVVIYLYYTITDVRKMSTELKKVTADVQSLATAVSKLNNEVNDVQKIGMDVNNMLASELQKCCVMPQVQVCEQKEAQDDAQSVDTVDIKKMLNDEDEDEELLAPAQDTEQENDPVAVPPPAPAKKPVSRKKST
jgi:hypothetical protein